MFILCCCSQVILQFPAISTHAPHKNSLCATPPTSKLPNVIFMAYNQLTISELRLSHNVLSTSVGAGKM